MGPIRNLFSTSPGLKHTESGKKAGKSADPYKKSEAVNQLSGNKSAAKDQVEISSAGRELLSLKAETRKYLDDVKNSRAVSPQELDAIKEKIASRHYFDDEVIEKVVDKMVNLPGMFEE